MNKILETTKFVVDNSENVKINHDKVIEFSKNFNHGNLPHWLSASPVSYSHLNNKDKLNFLLVFNSTSFCYWGEPKWTIEYGSEKYDGSWAMVASIMRAIGEGRPILDAKYRATVSREDYQEILRGNTEIPLFEERWNITKSVALTLLQDYNGDFGELIESVKGDVSKLLDLITSKFAAFADTAMYQGKTIYFCKRAQLLIEDIYQSFAGEGYGVLTGIDEITACADYKLPQSLRRLGILSYGEDLAKRIDNLVQIPRGSVEEVEIRANTIWAVEAIKEELKKDSKNFSSSAINDHLWLVGQVKNADDKPYHRTLTTAY